MVVHACQRASFSSRCPIARSLKYRAVRNRWFNRVRYAPTILARSFRSQCLIVRSIFFLDNEKLPLSLDGVWYVRLPLATHAIITFYPTQVLPLAGFTTDFSSDPPTPQSVGQWHAAYKMMLHLLHALCDSLISLLILMNLDNLWPETADVSVVCSGSVPRAVDQASRRETCTVWRQTARDACRTANVAESPRNGRRTNCAAISGSVRRRYGGQVPGPRWA